MPFIRFQLVLFGLAVLVQAVKDPFSALKRDYLDDAKDSVSRMRQKWCTTCLELCGNPNARYWDEHMNSEAFAVRRILRGFYGDRKPSDCMAICNEQLHPHMAEYIEFKSWQVNVGRAEMPSDTSADEIVSAWREADANRRKSCDGRDWEYADSKRPLPSLPDGSFYQRRRQRKQRVTKNNQDSPEAPNLDKPLSYDDATQDEIVERESALFKQWLTRPPHRLKELPQSVMELGGRLKDGLEDSFKSGIQSLISGPRNPAGALSPADTGFRIPRPIHP